MSKKRKPFSALVTDLEQFFERYAALPPGVSLVLTLWTVATYFFGDFDVFPYLAITSPLPRCGKTRVCELLEPLAHKPMRTVGITTAALFRTIQKHKPTLILDEAEALAGRGDRTEALREILNAGYKRGQKVIRCMSGETDYATREFETFCPKVIVLIGDLSGALADRCIPIRMARRTTEPLQRFRLRQLEHEARPLKAAVERFAGKRKRSIVQWYRFNDVPTLTDREAELWLPLFAVCHVAAPERLDDLEATALGLAGSKAEAETASHIGLQLLQDIYNTFEAKQVDRLSTNTILAELNSLNESPWPTWRGGRGLKDRDLSGLLRPFSIKSGTIRFSLGKTAKGYLRDSFREAWKCYLPTPPSTRNSVTDRINTGENGSPPSVTLPSHRSKTRAVSGQSGEGAPEHSGEEKTPPASTGEGAPPATEMLPERYGKEKAVSPNTGAGCYAVTDERRKTGGGISLAYEDLPD